MDFHPSQIPVLKTFNVSNEGDAESAAFEMVKSGFSTQQNGFKVLMPKDRKTATRIGFLLVNELNYGLRKSKQERDVRYWIYHHDKSHYAIVLISSKALEKLGL